MRDNVIYKLSEKRKIFIHWVEKERLKCKKAGEEMFGYIPDKWFEPKPKWGCENGHVSKMYLKSEVKGDVCLECYESVNMIPNNIKTDEELKHILCHSG